MKRAIDMVTKAMKAKGYQVVEVEIPKIEEQSRNALTIVTNSAIYEVCDYWWKVGNSLGTSITALMCLTFIPQFILKTLAVILKLLKFHRHADVIMTFTQNMIDDHKRLVRVRKEHLDDIQEVFQKNDLDALLIPPHPIPAFPNAIVDKVGLLPCGTRLPIYWQYCSAQIPITCVEENEETFEEKVHNDPMTEVCRQSMQGSKGMPVGLEVCGLPYQDEKILKISKMIQDEVKFLEKYPYPTEF